MPVLSRRPTAAVPRGRATATGIIVVAIAAVAILAAGATTLVPPSYVPRLAVTNGTDWYAEVAVRSEGQGGWVPLGQVPPHGEVTWSEVLDMGTSWEVRFSYGQDVEAVVVVDRATLANSGWQVATPEELAEEARSAGLAPSHTVG